MGWIIALAAEDELCYRFGRRAESVLMLLRERESP